MPPGAGTGQDKDALAVEVSPASPHPGRVFMAWTHHLGPPLTTYNSIELSSSDDHGRTWSRPSIVDRTGFGALTFTSLAVGRERRRLRGVDRPDRGVT